MTLKIKRDDSASKTCLYFSGAIDEGFDWPNLKSLLNKELVIDLGDVTAINSCGCRRWVKWMKELSTMEISVSNCPKIFIDQVNLIGGFIPDNGRVESFIVPYFCTACEEVTNKVFDINSLKDGVKDIWGSMVCKGCGNLAELDVITSTFFRFLTPKSKS